MNFNAIGGAGGGPLGVGGCGAIGVVGAGLTLAVDGGGTGRVRNRKRLRS
jgi:hypothetical protein